MVFSCATVDLELVCLKVEFNADVGGYGRGNTDLSKQNKQIFNSRRALSHHFRSHIVFLPH